MSDKILQTRIKQKIDTKANWDKAVNFVPLKGEIIVYSDLNKIKVGDGAKKVSELPFLADSDTHQSIKALNTNNTSAQTVSSSEAIAGSGTINLHKVAKTGSYNDLNDKPDSVTSVATADGITGGPITTSGTIKANLKSYTKNTAEIGGGLYGVELDKNGKLAVNVPSAGFEDILKGIKGRTKVEWNALNAGEYGSNSTYNGATLPPVILENNSGFWNSASGRPLDISFHFTKKEKITTLQVKCPPYSGVNPTMTVYYAQKGDAGLTLYKEIATISTADRKAYEFNEEGISADYWVVRFTSSGWIDLRLCSPSGLFTTGLYTEECHQQIMDRFNGYQPVGNYALKNEIIAKSADSLKLDGHPSSYYLNTDSALLKSGKQTTTSTADGGSNVYTFTDTKGSTSTFTVKNGSRGSQGPQGPVGPNGAAAGFGTPTASVDANVGTPSVTVAADGPNTAKTFAFAFKNLKGEKGATGAHISSVTGDKTPAAGNTVTYTMKNTDGTTAGTFKVVNGTNGSNGSNGAAAGFGTPTASVDANVGTPSVTVTASGANTAKVFNFAFKNLKGNTGATGPTGPTGSVADLTVSGTGNAIASISLNKSTKKITATKGDFVPRAGTGTTPITSDLYMKGRYDITVSSGGTIGPGGGSVSSSTKTRYADAYYGLKGICYSYYQDDSTYGTTSDASGATNYQGFCYNPLAGTTQYYNNFQLYAPAGLSVYGWNASNGNGEGPNHTSGNVRSFYGSTINSHGELIYDDGTNTYKKYIKNLVESSTLDSYQKKIDNTTDVTMRTLSFKYGSSYSISGIYCRKVALTVNGSVGSEASASFSVNSNYQSTYTSGNWYFVACPTDGGWINTLCFGITDTTSSGGKVWAKRAIGANKTTYTFTILMVRL